jgi:biopolymer transport protein ExbB/TolQ
MIAGIEQVIFRISQSLRIPVIVLALAALAMTLVELGSLTVELIRRRKRRFDKVEAAAAKARTFMAGGWLEQAIVSLRPVTWSNRMERAMEQLVGMVPAPRAEDRISKTLADFDYESLRRLERTRVLVRAGPALGLMGTLIPLAPGLAALAKGDVAELTVDLRLAFSITILGLLVGAVAFGISLVRDRLYGQDLSDLEYMVAVIIPGQDPVTETDLVRALGKAPRRPGRHSRPDDGHDDEVGGRRASAGAVLAAGAVPTAGDAPGVKAGGSAPGAASAEPPGLGVETPSDPSDDDVDYMAEFTAGLPIDLGDEPAAGEGTPNGDRHGGGRLGSTAAATETGEEGRP